MADFYLTVPHFNISFMSSNFSFILLGFFFSLPLLHSYQKRTTVFVEWLEYISWYFKNNVCLTSHNAFRVLKGPIRTKICIWFGWVYVLTGLEFPSLHYHLQPWFDLIWFDCNESLQTFRLVMVCCWKQWGNVWESRGATHRVELGIGLTQVWTKCNVAFREPTF